MSHLFIFLIIIFFGLSFDRLNVFKYCIVSSIFHEFGHIFAYIFFERKIPEIIITPFGFTMKNNVSYSKYYIYILFFGPAINILIVIITLLRLKNKFNLDIYIIMLVNIIIFITNIIPVNYLDGGQILYAKSKFYQRNYRLISGISIIILAVMVYGFTGNLVRIVIFLLYYAINTANDI